MKERIIATLTWMIADMDYRNRLNGKTVPDEDSEQMREAKQLLQEIKNTEEADCLECLSNRNRIFV